VVWCGVVWCGVVGWLAGWVGGWVGGLVGWVGWQVGVHSVERAGAWSQRNKMLPRDSS
jgi:hypothetical protein